MIKPISKLQIDMVAQLSWRSVLWLLLTRLVVVADLLVGFFVVDEIGVVGFFVCVCFFFLPLLVVLVVAISCGCWL